MLYSDPKATLAYITPQVENFIQMYWPWAGKEARFLEVTLREDIDVAAKRVSRRTQDWVDSLNLIVANTPEDDLASTVRSFLTMTEGMEEIVTTGTGKKLTITAHAGLQKPLIAHALSLFEDVGRGFEHIQVAVNADAAVDIISPSTNAMLTAFIHPDVGRTVGGAVPLLGEAKGVILKRLASDEWKEALEGMTFGEQLEALEDLLKSVYEAPHRKIKLEITPKTRNLFYKSIIAATAEEMFTKRVAHLVGPKFNQRMARAMNYFMSNGNYNEIPIIRDIELNDYVILKSEARQFNKLLNKVTQAKKTGRPDPRIRAQKGAPLTRNILEEEFMLSGKPARRVVEVIEDADGKKIGVLDDGERLPLDALTLRDGRLSMLDAFDGFMLWGMKSLALHRQGETIDALGNARKSYQRMVAHSMDESGNVSMIPRDILVNFSKQLDNIEKDLSNFKSIESTQNPIMRMGRQLAGKSLALFKRHILFGLLIPRPAFFMNQIFGDYAQMWAEIGIVEAPQIALTGSLAYIPIYGERLQDAYVSMVRKVSDRGIALPPVMGALFNTSLDDLLSGSKTRVIELPDGATMKAGDFMAEAIEDGVNENIRTFDFASTLREQARIAQSGQAGVRKGHPVLRDLYNVMEYKAREATRRQRLLLYSHLRINKGMARDDARRVLNNSLYDWTHSVGKFEGPIIREMALFYMFTKNAFGQVFRALFEGADEPLEAYLRKYVRGGTRMQRIELMTRLTSQFAPQIPGPYSGVPVDRKLTREEQKSIAVTRELPRFLTEYPIIGFNQLSPLSQDLFHDKGLLRAHYARVLPKLTPVEFTITTANIASMITAMALSGLPAYGLNKGRVEEELLKELTDMMNPLMRDTTYAIAEAMRIRPQRLRSEKGRRAREGEIEMLEFLGYTDSVIAGKTPSDPLRIRFSNPLYEGLYSVFGKGVLMESRRARTLATPFLGTEATGMARYEALAVDQGELRARIQAFQDYINLGHLYFYHGANNKEWDVKAAEKKLDQIENAILDQGRKRMKRR